MSKIYPGYSSSLSVLDGAAILVLFAYRDSDEIALWFTYSPDFTSFWGTLTGAISARLFVGWISFGSQYHHVSKGGIVTPTLPTSIEGCGLEPDVVLNLTSIDKHEYIPPWIYKISFYYYSVIGIVLTMVVGVIVSLVTGERDQKVELLSPVIYFLLPEDDQEYKVVDIIMKTIEKCDDAGYTTDNSVN